MEELKRALVGIVGGADGLAAAIGKGEADFLVGASLAAGSVEEHTPGFHPHRTGGYRARRTGPAASGIPVGFAHEDNFDVALAVEITGLFAVAAGVGVEGIVA